MRLYKYMPYARVDILQNRLICFTKPMAFNDPFDCSPHIYKSDELNPLGSRFYSLRTRPEDIGNPRHREEIVDHVRRSLAVDPSYTLDSVMIIDPDTDDNHSAFVNGFRGALEPALKQSVVVLSLTENQNSLLMWAHYAQNHEGFIVGFDSEHAFFKSTTKSPGKHKYLNRVTYSNDRPSGVFGALSEEKTYLTKSQEWDYEKEWRILEYVKNATKPVTDDKGPYHLFSFPTEAVVEVIMGVRASAETKEKIKGALADKETWPNVSLMQATIDKRHYRLNYESVPI